MNNDGSSIEKDVLASYQPKTWASNLVQLQALDSVVLAV
jgi:hypothetical protein